MGEENKSMMDVVIETINALYPLSPETVQALKESVTECRFPRRYQLVRAGIYCKYAYFRDCRKKNKTL